MNYLDENGKGGGVETMWEKELTIKTGLQVLDLDNAPDDQAQDVADQ